MTTPFTDWTFTNTAAVLDLATRQNYAELQYRTAKLINDKAGTPGRLFKTITGFLQEDEIVQSPSCIILPAGIMFAEQNISGPAYQIEYRFKVCIAIKHPNPIILFQMVSAYGSEISDAILVPANGDAPAQGVVIFDSVDGHANTQLESEPIEPVAELRNGVLVFSSGLNIVYTAWEDY